jgi:drug/metabolite transporter (DMT)-like permease
LFLGWLFVGETISLRTVLAAAVILAAVLLVITAPHREPIPAVRKVAKAAEA